MYSLPRVFKNLVFAEWTSHDQRYSAEHHLTSFPVPQLAALLLAQSGEHVKTCVPYALVTAFHT